MNEMNVRKDMAMGKLLFQMVTPMKECMKVVNVMAKVFTGTIQLPAFLYL